MPRARAASSIGQAGEVAELDEFGLCGGPRGELARASSRARVVGRLRSAMASVVEVDRARGRRRLGASCGGPCSTRMRRMASAAAAKKWPRLSQCWARSARPAADRPRGPGPWPGGSGRASPGPASGRPACAARRRPAARAVGGGRVAVLDGREDAGDVVHGDPAAADKLLPLVYDELRKLAAKKMAQERPGRPSRPPPWCMKRTCCWSCEAA